MKKWDYKTIVCAAADGERRLKEAGKEGWELVSVVKSDAGQFACYFYLKREIS